MSHLPVQVMTMSAERTTSLSLTTRNPSILQFEILSACLPSISNTTVHSRCPQTSTVDTATAS